jgi:hypothetical protein
VAEMQREGAGRTEATPGPEDQGGR